MVWGTTRRLSLKAFAVLQSNNDNGLDLFTTVFRLLMNHLDAAQSVDPQQSVKAASDLH